MTSTATLYSSFMLGDIALKNRIVMAPLTRNRATPGVNAPNDLTAQYYRQRAGAGLIISEAAQISAQGQGYAWTPGIYSREQIDAWRKTTQAVHDAGGRIFLQLWHVGRISHTSLQPDGGAPVAPSAIRAKAQTFIETGFVDVSEPRELETAEIAEIVADYARATRNALEAGFDGVEVHGANGYLIDQFLRDGTNARTDGYGGTLPHRARFALEVVEAVAREAGASRVGYRISPVSPANDCGDSDPQTTFGYLVEKLSAAKIAYIHVVEGATGGPRDIAPFDFAALRRAFAGAYMANNGYTRAMAEEAVAQGRADLVAFGRPYIANPDLAERLRKKAPLNEIDKATLYGGGAKGYTDYPALAG